jgi:hypothetical protein
VKVALVLSVILFSMVALMSSRSAGPSISSAPILVELFTSEGCSSCPSADRFLERLDRQPVPGADFIVLSEHVDYWNHIGWKDPYSSHSYSQRQSVYASRFGLDSVYTPQMVVDGEKQFTGSDETRARQVFDESLKSPKISVRISSVQQGPGPTVRVRVGADQLPDILRQDEAEIYLAIALNQAKSRVSAGENGGRILSHVAVVTELVKAGRVSRSRPFSQDVELKLGTGTDVHNLRLIAFVQEPGQGKVLGASERPVLP